MDLADRVAGPLASHLGLDGGGQLVVTRPAPQQRPEVGLPDGDLVLLTDLEIFGWVKPRRPVRAKSAAKDTFLSDLVPDSFMLVEVAVELQEEFDVIFTADDLDDVQTIGDLAALLQARR